MPKPISPLKAVVTGAASGLGKELTFLLIKEGYEVHLWDINLEELENIKQLNESSVFIYKVDLSDEEQINKAKDLVLSNSSMPVSLVVANAGVGAVNPAQNYSEKINTKVMMINTLGAMNTLTAFIPEMIKAKSGHLVAVSSLASLRGLPGGASYSASKAALNNFIESLALDLKGFNIQTTTILPGFIQTPMVNHNEFSTPFCIPVKTAAVKCLKAIKNKKQRLLFPMPMVILSMLNRLIPGAIYLKLASLIVPKAPEQAKIF